MDLFEEKRVVAEAMRKFGGSFVAALGEALLHADAVNALAIKAAWPQYWQEYLDLGAREAL